MSADDWQQMQQEQRLRLCWDWRMIPGGLEAAADESRLWTLGMEHSAGHATGDKGSWRTLRCCTVPTSWSPCSRRQTPAVVPAPLMSLVTTSTV